MPWGVAAATVAAAAYQANSAQHAAADQAGAAMHAADLTQDQFHTIQAQEKPYMDSGSGALSSLNNMLGIGSPTDTSTYGSLTHQFSPTDFYNNLDPGYGFQLQQGQKALQNSQAANDGVLSGAALKDLIGYNQGMASTAYNSAFNRYQTQQGNIYQRLAGIAQLGQNAAANTGAQGASLAATTGSNIANAGAAQASGVVGAANAYSSMPSNAMSMYAMYKMANSPMMSGSPITSGGT